ncbi:MAG: S8 family serine peptidase [Candidatus Bathyarchaeota archaeon]|nr:S8 family serine peptidase [Candidatus Bathyarchaeota archaeon]
MSLIILFSSLQIYGITIGEKYPDRDGDGIIDIEDNSPGISNPDQKDSDGDGVGDVSDNCPFSPNPGQRDSDGDGKGDVCDVESGVSSYTNLLLNTEVTVSSGQPFDIVIVEAPEDSVIDGVLNPVKVEISDEIQWALIKISYDDKVYEEALEVHSFVENIFAWYPVADSGVDTVNNYVWANVTGSGIFSPIDTTKTESTAIYLKSRYFIPTIGVGPGTKENIEVMPQERVHVLLNFGHDPTMEERAVLEKYGVTLLAHIHVNGWFSSIPKDSINEITDLPFIRWVGEILNDDKISPYIRQDSFGEWGISDDGNVTIIVNYFKDIELNEAKSIIDRYDGVYIGNIKTISAIVVSLPKERIVELAKEDIVQWIEQIPPPLTDANDHSREVIGVNVLQDPPYGLDGTGVIVTVYDGGGIINGTHPDFGGRVTIGTADIGSPVTNHSTHVAGTLGGDGALSGGLYRGMATNVSIISYHIDQTWGANLFYNSIMDIETDLNESIRSFDSDFVSSSTAINIYNNYPGNCIWLGDYESTSQSIDSIVRGSLGVPYPLVWCAGNERTGANGNVWGCGAGTNTTGTPATAKNSIVVGAVDSDDNAIMVFSSWGPTDDGRIRPDVVAAGGQNNTYFSTFDPNWDANSGEDTSIWSTIVPGGRYYGMSGTSMATPAVSGSVALMLQDFRNTHTYDPLPSTWKAILVHTAVDLDRSGNGAVTNDGPDYVNGWGLVNATAGVDLIRDDTMENPRLFEESISMVGEVDADYYSLAIPLGIPELRVTIAWDDAPGVPNSALRDLENDLDLTVFDSTGSVFHPWVLDPTNPGNAAGNGVDDLNNVEQVRIANPATGLWTIKVNASALPYPPQMYSLVVTPSLNATELVPKRHSVVLTLDSSGSMDWDMSGTSDVPDADTRLYKAQEGSTFFLDLLYDFYPDQATFGVVSFPDHPHVTHPDSEIVYPLTKINATTRTDAQNKIDAMTASSGTPMAEGLISANNMLTNPAENKTIVLFTDGYHTCPTSLTDYYASYTDRLDVQAYFDTILDGIKDKNIKVYTIGYGKAKDVDHILLQHIATETGAGGIGIGSYNATDMSNENLVPAFQEVFVQGMGLEAPVDPIVMINGGEEKTHFVNITEYDNKVAFTLSSADAQVSSLQFSLITPDDELIDPTVAAGNNDVSYVSRGTYQIYFIKGSFLKNRPGEWEISVYGDFSGSAEYSYGVITESTLKMESLLDKEIHQTGDSIQIRATVTGNTVPLTGSKVYVLVQKPDAGLGNWYADNPVTEAELAMMPLEVDGEQLSDVYRKSMALMAEGVDFPSTASQASLELYDDGTHGDENADDGVYTNTYDVTTTEGIYTFSFSANGITPTGISYTRESMSQRYVEVGVKPNNIQIGVFFDEVVDAELRSYYTVTVTPKDPYDNFLGPGYADYISLTATRGEFVSDIEDNLDGTYTVTLRTPSYMNEEDIDIRVNVGDADTTFNLDEESDRPDDGISIGDWLKWAIVIVVLLIIILLIWFFN